MNISKCLGGGVDAATLWPRYAPARRPPPRVPLRLKAHLEGLEIEHLATKIEGLVHVVLAERGAVFAAEGELLRSELLAAGGVEFRGRGALGGKGREFGLLAGYMCIYCILFYSPVVCVDIGELLRSELLAARGVQLCGRGALQRKRFW